MVPERPTSLYNWEGKIVLITGASRGIGRQLGIQLVRSGAHVWFGMRNPAMGDGFVRELQEGGGSASIVALDVASTDSIAGAVGEIEARSDRIDVLINNAAAAPDYGVRAVEISETLIRQCLDTNLIGPWLLSQQLLPLLRKSRSGVIANITATAGAMSFQPNIDPAVGWAGYRVSKAGLNLLSSILSIEVAHESIRVLSIVPGVVDTDIAAPALTGARAGAAENLTATVLSAETAAAQIISTIAEPPPTPPGGLLMNGEYLSMW